MCTIGIDHRLTSGAMIEHLRGSFCQWHRKVKVHTLKLSLSRKSNSSSVLRRPIRLANLTSSSSNDLACFTKWTLVRAIKPRYKINKSTRSTSLTKYEAAVELSTKCPISDWSICRHWPTLWKIKRLGLLIPVRLLVSKRQASLIERKARLPGKWPSHRNLQGRKLLPCQLTLEILFARVRASSELERAPQIRQQLPPPVPNPINLKLQ